MTELPPFKEQPRIIAQLERLTNLFVATKCRMDGDPCSVEADLAFGLMQLSQALGRLMDSSEYHRKCGMQLLEQVEGFDFEKHFRTEAEITP